MSMELLNVNLEILELQRALDKGYGLHTTLLGRKYSTPARLHTTQRMRRMQNGEGDASEDGGPRSTLQSARRASQDFRSIAIAPTHENLN